jgi:hypothetical protein
VGEDDGGAKIKGRLKAADEKTGVADILFLAIVREHRGQDHPGKNKAYSLFVRQ